MMINTHTEFLFGLMLTIGSPQNNYLLTVFSRAGRRILFYLLSKAKHIRYTAALFISQTALWEQMDNCSSGLSISHNLMNMHFFQNTATTIKRHDPSEAVLPLKALDDIRVYKQHCSVIP